MEMKIKTTPKRLLLFLIFPTLLKTNKVKIFKPKTLLKLAIKTLKKMRIFALEIVS